MAFEVTIIYHPRKPEGGYDTEKRETDLFKIGQGFEDIPLEKLAAAVMAQLARRDVWVVDAEISELIKRPVSFKESKDGKGILLKNKRFSVNSSAQMICEETTPVVPELQPHEKPAIADDLYSNPNRSTLVKKQINVTADQRKVLYRVKFMPDFLLKEAKQKGLKFTEDKVYPVHEVITHGGQLDKQELVLTDDRGQAVQAEEKYFTAVGMGLLADDQLGFTKSAKKEPKLAFEDQMYLDEVAPKQVSKYPVDDGNIPSNLLQIPDIRKGK